MFEKVYRVTFVSYCGMVRDLDDCATRDEAAALVKRRNAHYRKCGLTVSKIEANTWEYETPDDAALIGDDEGTLIVRRVSRLRRGRR